MDMHKKITIILPVFGRAELLRSTLGSVGDVAGNEWSLLIADDGSDEVTADLIKGWIAEHSEISVKWKRRSKNLGLFANLNQAIRESETDWVLLLCSDDLLLGKSVSTIRKLQEDWPNASIIISSFESINSDGTSRPPDSAYHHDQIRMDTGLIGSKDAIRALLKLGSINGNLTGMAFRRRLWEEVGEFKEDWRHAADWEWMVRVAGTSPILLNREPIARVRTHEQQLSNCNRRSGHELDEVANVVSTLISHPLLKRETQRWNWAAHVMQFQLWNTIKSSLERPDRQAIDALWTIHKSVGLRRTIIAFVRWMPKRWEAQRRQNIT